MYLLTTFKKFKTTSELMITTEQPVIGVVSMFVQWLNSFFNLTCSVCDVEALQVMKPSCCIHSYQSLSFTVHSIHTYCTKLILPVYEVYK